MIDYTRDCLMLTYCLSFSNKWVVCPNCDLLPGVKYGGYGSAKRWRDCVRTFGRLLSIKFLMGV